MSKQKSCSGWREIIIGGLALTALPPLLLFTSYMMVTKFVYSPWQCSAGVTLSLTFSFCLIPRDLSAFVSLEERLESRKKVCESFHNTFCLPICSLWGFFFRGQLSPPVLLWYCDYLLAAWTSTQCLHFSICELGAVLSMVLFAGQLSGQNQQTVGTLDLGGASTQITFLPRFEVRSG